MPIYKGFDTSTNKTKTDLKERLREARAELDLSATEATAISNELGSWRKAHPGKSDDPGIVARLTAANQHTGELEKVVQQLEENLGALPHMASREEVEARNRQALANGREPDQSMASSILQGAGEGFNLGKRGVKKAAIGAAVGLWHVGGDVASYVAAGDHAIVDDLTGNIKDERKQVQKYNATGNRIEAAFEGATGSEEGGWLRSIVESAATAAGGQGDQAINQLEAIPTDELAGLNPSSPNFSENMASLGINVALFAVGAREPLLKRAGALESQAAKLAKTGLPKDAAAAAKLANRANAYRKLAAMPAYGDKAIKAFKASLPVKALAGSGFARTLTTAAKAANRFKNPLSAIEADKAGAGRLPGPRSLSDSDTVAKTVNPGRLPVHPVGGDPWRVTVNEHGQIVAGSEAYRLLAKGKGKGVVGFYVSNVKRAEEFEQAFRNAAEKASKKGRPAADIEALENIANSIKTAREFENGTFAVVSESAGQSTFRHEGIHQGQRAVSGSSDLSNHLDTSKPKAAAYLNDTAYLQAERYLKARSPTYRKPNTAVYEVPAYVGSGDFGELGLDEEGASHVMGLYYEALVEEYGVAGANRVFHLATDDVKQVVGAGPSEIPYKSVSNVASDANVGYDLEHVKSSNGAPSSATNGAPPLPMRPVLPVGTNTSPIPEAKLHWLWNNPY